MVKVIEIPERLRREFEIYNLPEPWGFSEEYADALPSVNIPKLPVPPRKQIPKRKPRKLSLGESLL